MELLTIQIGLLIASKAKETGIDFWATNPDWSSKAATATCDEEVAELGRRVAELENQVRVTRPRRTRKCGVAVEGYARRVLKEFARVEGRGERSRRFVDEVACAYCRGSGAEPKYDSRCHVCGATGRVKVEPPVVTCLECAGSGCEGGDLTCLACRGVGVVSVMPDASACRRCRGTGQDGIFYCASCKGQGIV